MLENLQWCFKCTVHWSNTAATSGGAPLLGVRVRVLALCEFLLGLLLVRVHIRLLRSFLEGALFAAAFLALAVLILRVVVVVVVVLVLERPATLVVRLTRE